MGRRGPAPEPTSLRLLKGKRPLNRNEPKPRPIAPSCPRWLDPEARKEWRRLAPELERLGLLTVLDRAVFAIYCTCWSDFKMFSEIIRREGAVISGHRGVPRKHPLLPALHWAMDAVRVWSQEFGLTPLSRSRLSIPQTEDTADPPWLD